MKSAFEARREAEIYKESAKFEEDIERGIERAISKGKFSTTITFNYEIPDSIRDEIGTKLESLGYHFSMPKYQPQPASCPIEQCRLTDTLIISWSEITV